MGGCKSWQPWFRERAERKRVTWTEYAGREPSAPYNPTHWRAQPIRQTAPSRFLWEDTWARFDERKAGN